MNTLTSEIYRGWKVIITPAENLCANFSFDIISPSGDSRHVAMGGHSVLRALERAKEMIDMEIAVAGDE